MLIRGPASRDFFESEPYFIDWIGPAIWLIAALAVLAYTVLNFGMVPSGFEGLG